MTSENEHALEYDLVLRGPEPIHLFLGNSRDDVGEFRDSRYEPAGPQLLADIICDASSREFLGVFFPLDKQELDLWYERSLDALGPKVTRLEPPLPLASEATRKRRSLSKRWSSVQHLVIRWSQTEHEVAEVGQLTHPCWLTKTDESGAKGEIVAFAVLNLQNVLEFNDLKLPRNFIVDEVMDLRWGIRDGDAE